MASSEALKGKAAEFDTVLKAGRTHLQDAVPVRLGQEFGAYAAAVEHDRERIARAGETLQRLGIGGTATGTGLNSDPRYHQAMVDKLIRFWRASAFGARAICSSRCRAQPISWIYRRHCAPWPPP